MPKLETCESCGVPLMVSKEQSWGDNGVIAQTADPAHRMLFYESDNIDQLFAGIEDIIGLPVEHIVIESKAREVRAYVENMLSPLARKAGRLMGTNMMVKRLSRMGRAYGYGDIAMESRGKNERGEEYITMSVRNPHSVLFFCGENLGAWEAIQGRDHKVVRDRVAENEYKITNVAGDHPVGLSGMLKTRNYEFKPGDIQLDRCETCGVPLLVGSYRWDLDEGTIVHPETGRRMAIFGPAGLEAVFNDLAAELGDAIPEAVIEAQRRHVKEVMAGPALAVGDASYREMLAIRGLGDLTEFDGSREALAVTLENSCLTLMTVGMLQAFFELGAGRHASEYAYVAAPDGRLKVDIRAL
jgi:hypothetical protein